MRDSLLYAAGLGFLGLAKAKNLLRGYSAPKPFELGEVDRCVAYDIKVVDEWLIHLAAFTGNPASLTGKNILELGPGSDLGAGLYLLAKGAAAYHACDVNDLMQAAPENFYTAFLDRISMLQGDKISEALRLQLANARVGAASRLRVAVRDDFDIIAAFGRETMDLVFSQAAFEHFDDIDRTVRQLTAVCKPGAIIVAEIDLKTHSRWIRDKDPNNIYRYAPWIYRTFWFRGIPNRVRPYQYKQMFEHHGWAEVSITTIEQTKPQHPAATWLHEEFRAAENEMGSLSVVLCARKPG